MGNERDNQGTKQHCNNCNNDYDSGEANHHSPSCDALVTGPNGKGLAVCGGSHAGCQHR